MSVGKNKASGNDGIAFIFCLCMCTTQKYTLDWGDFFTRSSLKILFVDFLSSLFSPNSFCGNDIDTFSDILNCIQSQFFHFKNYLNLQGSIRAFCSYKSAEFLKLVLQIVKMPNSFHSILHMHNGKIPPCILTSFTMFSLVTTALTLIIPIHVFTCASILTGHCLAFINV